MRSWPRTLILCATFLIVIWLFHDDAMKILEIARIAAENCTFGG